MKLLRRMLYSLFFIVSVVWLSLAVLLYVFQTRIIYYPEKNIEFTPAAMNMPYEDVFLTTDDGVRIHGWYIERANSRSTVLFLHGNAGNISHRLESIGIFYEMGMSVFIIDYRGFGQSEGTPSENGTYLDARAAWSYLTVERNLGAGQITVFGRSLGAAVAVWLAGTTQPGTLIIESAFTSMPEMGKKYYPYLPVGLLARVRYPSIDRIGLINCPVLVVHSRADEIIPFEFGQALYARVKGPKEFLEISGGHNDGFIVSGHKYIEGLRTFIRTHTHQDMQE